MIQLTKGKNVLDINLSDYSGAGQDVVQNGSFTDIGSDLILNGDFAEIGSDLVTNGDFSAEGINLVSNPNFTDGVEKIVDGDFPFPNTAWSLNTGVTVPSAGILDFDGTGGAYASQDILTSGNSYKVTIEVADASLTDTLVVFLGATNTILESVVAADTTIVLYGVAGGLNNRVYVGSWEGTITSVSVKELGADWTVVDNDATHYVEFIETGARFVSPTTSPIVQLKQTTFTLLANISYKLTVDMTRVSGGVKFETGGVSETFSATTSGTNNTRYITPTSDVFLTFIRSSSNVDLTFHSISVQELGEGWTLFSDVSVGEDKLICDNVAAYTSIASQSGIVPTEKSVKVTYDVVVDSGAFRLLLGSGGTTSEVTTSGTKVFYETSGTGGDLTLQAMGGGFDGSVTNITVQEVGQDWTPYTSGTSTVDFPSTGAELNIDALNSNVGIYQSGIFTLGKSYKIVLSMKATSAFDAEILESSGASTVSTIGTVSLTTSYQTFTLYHLGTGTYDLFIHRLYTETLGASQTISIQSVIVQQLDTNDRWVTFADPASKSVMKLGQVDLEIDSSGNNCGVYQTGLIKPNKLYIITINMKATAALNVEIAASLGTTVSAVIGTTALTTSYVEYSFEYVTPFAVAHDLQIHRLLGSGDSETISIDYVSMNGVDESKWINDPTWNPFATSLVFVPTLTDESTNNSKQFTLDTSIADGGWDGRSLHGQVIINESPTEDPANGEINLEQPNFLEGFYQVEIRGYLGTFYRILGKGMAHLERASTEDGYNRFEAYNDSVTYKAYEE